MQTPESTIERFTKEQVLEELRAQCARDGVGKVAASLEVSKPMIGMILNGQRHISVDLALRFGFTKLPDAYVRTVKTKTK